MAGRWNNFLDGSSESGEGIQCFKNGGGIVFVLDQYVIFLNFIEEWVIRVRGHVISSCVLEVLWALYIIL